MLAFLFSPSGRIGRAKWWLIQVIAIAVAIFILVLIAYLNFGVDVEPSTTNLMVALSVFLLSLLLLWMTFCAAVKRYHDRNKSAWWYLIQFIPLIGGIWAFVELGFCSGDDGDNDYGYGPDMNIEEDLRAMMGGMPSKADSAPQRTTVAPAYQAARVNNSGTPVFGKRG